MKFSKVPKFLKSVRYCLAAVNGLFLLTGLLLLGVGIGVLVVYREYDLFTTQRFISLPSFTIATGVFILCSSVLGFYGAISESFYFVAGYVVTCLVVLVFQVAVVIVGFGLRNDASSVIRVPMSQSIALYESRREVAIMWDDLQMGFECCGVIGRHDWVSTRIPLSCCHIDYGTVSPFECTNANAYTTGCAPVLGAWLAYNAEILAIAAICALCLQILITLAAGWLAYRTKFDEVELES